MLFGFFRLPIRAWIDGKRVQAELLMPLGDERQTVFLWDALFHG